MEKWRSFLGWLPVILTGLLFNYAYLKYRDDIFVWSLILLFLLGTIFLITLFWTLVMGVARFRRSRSLKSLLPGLAGVGLLLLVTVTHHCLNHIYRSPLLLQAGYDGQYTGAWFAFRQDGSYQFCNTRNPERRFYNGSYSIQDSLIKLASAGIDQMVCARSLAIRKVKLRDSSSRNMLFQIDNLHRVIEHSPGFLVYVDRRAPSLAGRPK